MARNDGTTKLLGSVDIFTGLKKRDLNKVAATLKELSFPEGAVVTAEGDIDARFYIIADGTARVTVNGRKRRVLSPGDYFGEIALIDGGTRSSTITAESPLRTYSLAPWNFKPLLKENPDIAYKILLEMCKRLRNAEKSLTQ